MIQTFTKLLPLVMLLAVSSALSHPGSGIVVDRHGNVYFVDTGSGVWKIDREGTLTRLRGPAYHWMAIDIDDRLAKTALPYFASQAATVTRVGTHPTLLLSSDFPLSVGPDGGLYYPWIGPEDQVQIFRLTPTDTTTVIATLPPSKSERGRVRWRNGITVSENGTIYFSEDRGIQKASPDGRLEYIVTDLDLPGCGSVASISPDLGPYLRGLEVDSSGAVYVAAAGCRAVIKVTPDKRVTTILQATSPWSPTAVAISGSDVYVLEYTHTAGDNRLEWMPRVRKISADGSVSTMATIDRR
jgi:streptogramin lyase